MPDLYLAAQSFRTIAEQSTRADAKGVATATFPQVPTGNQWRIERVWVSCNSTSPTELVLYVDYPGEATASRGGTAAGNGDEADYTSPILVASEETLFAQWTAASPGAVGLIRVQVAEYTIPMESRERPFGAVWPP